MISYATTIFLGALLLFQVQPVIARYILPWFGGTPAVWTAAMLFFQVMLLAGYIYTHLVVSKLTAKWQVYVHATLLLLSLLVLPITPANDLKPDGAGEPLLQILLLLFISVGASYFLVASTAPLMQSWFSKANENISPYKLYALSNFGSFLGLLSYPLIVEPMLGLKAQTYLWSILYGGFVATSLCSCWSFMHSQSDIKPVKKDIIIKMRQKWSDKFMWLILSGTGVVVLLAATNQLCKDVAVVPLLWILPLTLYLLSFIITFGQPQLYIRSFWITVTGASIACVIYLMHLDYTDVEIPLYPQIFIYSMVVFSCCMVCHGEVYQLKPAAEHLTSFYLMISLGGALGGVFVNLLAPYIFLGYWEFHASLLAIIILIGVCVWRDRSFTEKPVFRFLIGGIWAVSLSIASLFLWTHIQLQQDESIYTKRGFYGVLRVYNYENKSERRWRAFYHGRISHGEQFLDPELRRMPTTYFGPNSGIGVAINTQRAFLKRNGESDALDIGVIGLGVATIAAYVGKADSIRFYEINPDVIELAKSHFKYLSDTQATVEIVEGDARISMEREIVRGMKNKFDVLAVDAFSGDAIPVHLLTQEALSIYHQHLRQGGIIAFHISNLYFDLRPVILALAKDTNTDAFLIEDDGTGVGEEYNDWVLLTNNRSHAGILHVKSELWSNSQNQDLLWTDDFSDVLSALWQD